MLLFKLQAIDVKYERKIIPQFKNWSPVYKDVLLSNISL